MQKAKELGILSVPELKKVSKDYSSKKELEFLIENEFGAKEDLSDFLVKEKGSIELISKDGSRGYVFLYKSGRGNSYDENMIVELMAVYDVNFDLNVHDKFIDEIKGVSGFAWGEKPGTIH